jgi:hypothetical protein
VEGFVLNGTKKRANENSSIRVKHADGSITVDGAREQKERRKKESNGSIWEHQMNEVIKIERAKLAALNTTAVNCQLPAVSPPLQNLFEVEEMQMSSFLEKSSFTTEGFLYDAYRGTKEDPPPSVYEAVRKMGGLNVLVSVFCSREYDFDKSQKELEMMGVQYLDARIMHTHLKLIRRAAVASIPQGGTPSMHLLHNELLSNSSSSFHTSSSSDYGEPTNYSLLDDIADTTPRSN